MCTIKEVKEAIRENCQSQYEMESAEIDRIFQTLPFSQKQELHELSRCQRPLFWFYARRYGKL